MELLLVGAGAMGTPYVPAARRQGARICLIETAHHLERLRDSVDVTYETPGGAEEAWARTAFAAAADRAFDGVLAFSEPQVIAAALLQDQLALPGPSLRAALISRNKALQRSCFGARGVPQPEYLLADDLGAASDWARDRFPVVVKPLTGAGSVGVEYVPDAAGYLSIVARRSGGGQLLVESAIAGPEFSCEALVDRRRVVFSNLTVKETTGPPHFVETGHRAPHSFDPPTAARIDRFVREVVAVLGVATGIIHLEFRLAPTGPMLIEIAVRTPGDYLMDMLSLVYGLDMYEAVVRMALGLPPDLPAPCRPQAYAAVRMVLARPGRITAVEGLAEVRRHPAVVRAEVRRQPGDVVGQLRSSGDRVGHVLLRAGSPAELAAAETFVEQHLRVLTEAADGSARDRPGQPVP